MTEDPLPNMLMSHDLEIKFPHQILIVSLSIIFEETPQNLKALPALEEKSWIGKFEHGKAAPIVEWGLVLN